MKDACVVCLGDSITWGFPYGPEYSWVKIVSAALGIRMINRGINGETADDLLRRFRKDVLDRKPSHVFILVGANDASFNVPLKSFSESIQKIYTQAVSDNIQVLLGLPIPCTEKWLEFTMEKYRSWLRDFAADKGIPLVDFAPKMLKGDSVNSAYFTDGVHPNKAGYEVMAEVVSNFFEQERE